MKILGGSCAARIAIATMARPALIGLFFVGFAQAQSEVKPEFEVASIRQHQGDIIVVGLEISGTRVTESAVTIRDLIMDAYGLKGYQLEARAKLLESPDRYDIVAKATGDSAPTSERTRQMLQSLLFSRFQLKVHSETREMPIYVLTISKNGSKLTESSGRGPLVRFFRKDRNVRIVFSGAPIGSLVSQLPRMPGVDRPVIDRTSLTGKYDFELNVSDVQLNLNPEARAAISGADLETNSVFAALQEQLGLRLKADKGPVEIYVVDRVEKPSEN